VNAHTLTTYRAQGYRLAPVIRTYAGALDPADAHDRLGWHQDPHILLESGKMGHWSFIGGRPFATFRAKQMNAQFTHRDGSTTAYTGAPLDILRTLMATYRAPRIPGLPKFCGGAVGYFSYDLVRHFEQLPTRSADDLELPDVELLLLDELCAIDHAAEQTHLIVHVDLADPAGLDAALTRAEQTLDRLERQLFHSASQAPAFSPLTAREDWRTSFTQADFEQAVVAVQDYIRTGDVFQVNLSVRQGRTLGAHPWQIYRHLRRINPSPYASYLHFPDRQIVSSSPELLVRSLDRCVDTRPIAGTRPRTGDEALDRAAIAELQSNEKENAEHIMLVDLERNDLGRVCRYGTVEVNELMVIEEYSHVFHIVSNVRGELAADQDAYDLIRATFPGGTITGAPKIRCMEIIEELEPTRRGLYTGSIGWIDFNGDMELNIVIRTLLVQDGIGYVQAGAGIVIDSVPEREYYESLRKAQALWVAIEEAEAAVREGATS